MILLLLSASLIMLLWCSIMTWNAKKRMAIRHYLTLIKLKILIIVHKVGLV